jgi:tRNA 2-selenouridine synthase
MIETTRDVQPSALASYDDVIDVRAPSEFAEDHLPGAINLPVLSDAERAAVGAIYVQDSRFRARRLGAALVARNVAAHLETALAAKPAKWRPLLYCWRGGMRSNSIATILSQIGWRVGVVEGGYRTWRRSVVAALRGDELSLRLVLIDGPTGVGKSAVIGRLAAHGAQGLDLEALAHHRGSVFGGYVDAPQPSQKLFESRLWTALSRLDLSRPIHVEAESAKIGRVALPQRLWAAMKEAPAIALTAPIASRTEHILRAYGDAIADPASLTRALDALAPFHAKETIADWRALAAQGDFAALAEALMAEHYDPAYARSRARRDAQTLATIDLGPFDAAAIDRAAAEIASLSADRSPGE